MNFDLVFYNTESGKCPVEKFLKEQSKEMQVRIVRDLELLSEYGNTLGMPYTKHLEDGIFELRIKGSNNIARLLYFYYIDKQIILTNAFIKKQIKHHVMK